MNAIRQVEALNKTELENAVPPEASWHADYRDTAYIYIGGLPFDLSEGDILTIFSQFGNPVHLNLVRDKETGKSRGFAFLKYEDQRSTDLAVDNLGGATVLGRLLRVDHVRYKRRDEEGTEDNLANVDERGNASDMGNDHGGDRDHERDSRKKPARDSSEEPRRPPRPLLKEEVELQRLMDEHDDEDPMKEYLIKEKKEEVEKALALVKPTSKSKSKSSRRERSRDGERSHRHRHHHRRRPSEERLHSKDRRSPNRSRRERSRERSNERRRHRERRDRS